MDTGQIFEIFKESSPNIDSEKEIERKSRAITKVYPGLAVYPEPYVYLATNDIFKKILLAPTFQSILEIDFPQFDELSETQKRETLKFFEKSESLFFEVLSRKIFIFQGISEQEMGELSVLLTYFANDKGMIDKLEAMVLASQLAFPTCAVKPSGDQIQNFTEGYWALKGNSVLHHWVHFYQGSITDGSAAHYGRLIPKVTKFAQEALMLKGPTNFVKISWVILFIISIAYTFSFLWLFRNAPIIAGTFLSVKLFIFSDLGLFSVALGPGPHYFRDFLLLIAGPSYFVLFSNLLKSGSFLLPRKDKLTKSRYVALFKFVVLSFVMPFFFICLHNLDSFFHLGAVACFICALLLYNATILKAFFRSYALRAIIFGTLLALTSSLLAFQLLPDLTYSIHYAIASFFENPGGLLSLSSRYAKLLSVIFIVAVTMLVLKTFGKKDFLALYFSLISLFSLLYTIITPDRWHFHKTLELSIPLFCLATINIWNYLLSPKFRGLFDGWNQETDKSSENSNYAALAFEDLAKLIKKRMKAAIVFFQQKVRQISRSSAIPITAVVIVNLALSISSISSFYSERKETVIGYKSLIDNQYFESKPFSFEGRTFVGNINEKTEAKLLNFPSSVKFDFLLSELDKHILFIFDLQNGFGTPDLISYLSNLKNRRLFFELFTERPGASDILESYIPPSGMFLIENDLLVKEWNKYVVSKQSFPFTRSSVLQSRGLVSAIEIGKLVRKRCEPHLPPNKYWSVYKCP